jgi:hypothetical protein
MMIFVWWHLLEILITMEEMKLWLRITLQIIHQKEFGFVNIPDQELEKNTRRKTLNALRWK